jgi:hypothetical protein
MSSVGQSAFQMCGKAVARHDVEADAWQQYDAPRASFGVPRGEGLEHVNFAGDVEVVDAITKTGICHRFRRCREWPGDAKHDRNVLDRRINSAWIAKIECAKGKPERPCDRVDFCQIASRQDRACAVVRRHFRDQLPSVAGGAVDQDCPAQGEALLSARVRMPQRPAVVTRGTTLPGRAFRQRMDGANFRVLAAAAQGLSGVSGERQSMAAALRSCSHRMGWMAWRTDRFSCRRRCISRTMPAMCWPSV